MSTLYHKVGRLSRGKSENYCKTSAPRKPTKQAPINKNKNVIFSPSILLYIIDQHKPKPLDNSEKYPTFFLLRFSLNKRAKPPWPAILAVWDSVALNPSRLAPVPLAG
jgi:hypothetical protein